MVNGGGNVGIGTITPSQKLHVSGSFLVGSGTSPDTNSGIRIVAPISTTHYNWMLAAQQNVSDVFEITPSTAVGGTTFSSPVAVFNGANGRVGIGTTSPSYTLDVGGSFRSTTSVVGEYTSYGFTIAAPSPAFGDGRSYIRLHTTASGARIASFKIRLSTTWNYDPGFGYIDADVSYYFDGTSLIYPSVNVTSATGRALYSIALGDLVIESGYVSLPVYIEDTNTLYVKIEGSPSFDYSLITTTSWSSVTFPGSNTVTVPGNFSVGGSTTLTNDLNLTYGYPRINLTDTGANSDYSIINDNGGFSIYDSTNNLHRLYITSGGNVGIGGTITPGAKLEVTASAAIVTDGAPQDTVSYAPLGVTRAATAANLAYLGMTKAGTVPWGIGVASNDALIIGTVTATTQVISTPILAVKHDTQRVGVGTTSPSTRLHTAGSTQSTAAAGVARLGFADSSSVALFTNADPAYGTLFGTLSTGKGWIQQQRVDGTATAYDLSLQPNGGNVGIGTTSPYEKLEVAGAISAGGGWVGDASQGAVTTIGYQSGYGFVQAVDWGVAYQPLSLNPNGGDVGIGDTTPSYKLDVDGTIRATGDVIAYSDARVKENIETITDALTKVISLRGVTYTRKDSKDKSTKIGVIAQEVLKVLPEVVQQDDNGNYSVAYGNIVGILIESIKELKAEIDILKNKT
jgi:hypothetical protein